jgi:hypothetical protein
LIAMIQSEDDKAFICEELYCLVDRECGPAYDERNKALLEFAISLNPDLDRLMQENINDYDHIQRVMSRWPHVQFDFSKPHPETGNTCLHTAVKTGGPSTRNTEIIVNLIALNPNSLFARNKENKFPADCRFKWPLQRETFLGQMYAFLVGFYDSESKCFHVPREIYLLIAMQLAQIHCQTHSLALMNIAKKPEPDAWCLSYKK